MSKNSFLGKADTFFSPSVLHINFSHNNFSSVGSFKFFKSSHQTLRTADLSHKNIKQNASEIFQNIPPKIEDLFLSNNQIAGTSPNPLETVESLRRWRMDNNNLIGTVPDIELLFSHLKELNLSNQICGECRGATYADGEF